MDICKKCKGTNMMAIEYGSGPYRYDGISEYKCQDCKSRYGRWSGKKLKKGQLECPFGDKKMVTNELKEWNL